MREWVVRSSSETESLELGRQIGVVLNPGAVVALWGELGAGKTLITRGIAYGLGVPPSCYITSPTFTIINEYDGRVHLYHLDLYRIACADDLETVPWREALFGDGIAVVEWPERLGEVLPEERLDIFLEITGDETRTISLQAHGERILELLDRVVGNYPMTIEERQTSCPM